MTRYLISFNDGAMDHIPDEDMPAVAKAAHAVVQEALNVGVYLFAGGLAFQRPSVVATDGSVTDGPYPQTKDLSGGFTVVDVPTREAALEWAAKIAVACRCAQEVREFGPDPELDAMLRQEVVAMRPGPRPVAGGQGWRNMDAPKRVGGSGRRRSAIAPLGSRTRIRRWSPS